MQVSQFTYTYEEKFHMHCQCILSIFPASMHQFYANLLVLFVFLYNNDQFALKNVDLFSYMYYRHTCNDENFHSKIFFFTQGHLSEKVRPFLMQKIVIRA